MFLSLREIVTAKARVALMAGVVAMITLLIIMLTGLTGGLGKQNTQALESLDAPGFVFADNEDPSFSTSQVRAKPGEIALGVAQTRVGDSAAALFALPAGYASPVGKIPARGIIASAQLGFSPGQVVNISGLDTQVVAVADDSYYSHVPVVWGPQSLWQAVARSDQDGTVLISDGPGALAQKEAFAGLPAYSSEHGSLLTMQALLYAISALVTVAFLSVWTIQRTRDLSILRALGASARYLLRDALGQAALLVGAGVVTGAIAGVACGLLVVRVVPFQLDFYTVAGPAAGVWLLGMAGAFLATRRVSKTNPLLALGGQA